MHLFGTHYKATAWMFLGVCVFAVADHLTGLTLLADVAAILLAVFVVIEFRAAPRAHKYIGAILIAAGLAAGAWAGAFEHTVFTGFRRSMQFLVLWGAVLWLRMPPERSPSFQVMRDFVGGQPQGRRYMILALAGNFVGGTLNLAGVSLLSGLLTTTDDPTTRRRLTQALVRGFLAASCWSPFYVAVAVILVVIPGVDWIEVAPAGLLMALGLIGLSWTTDRIRRGKPSPSAALTEAPRMGLLTWLRLSTIAVCLFALVLIGTELLGVSVPIVLGLIAPPFALAWTYAHATPGDFVPLAREMGHRVMEAFPTLRGESLVFLSANIFGAGIAAALPPETVARGVEAMALPIDARIILLTLFMELLGAFGLHPVLMVVVIGNVLPPEVLGLSPAALALLLLAMWGNTIVLSPFAATILFLARVVGVSTWTVAWRWNGIYGFTTALLLALLFVAFRHVAG